MKTKFDVIILDEAETFIDSLDEQARRKVLYNLDKARYYSDPKLFKKLTSEIWEFRTKYNGQQYRLFAFWDKRDTERTFVISTHGIVKKFNRIPKSDIEKAQKEMIAYLTQ